MEFLHQLYHMLRHLSPDSVDTFAHYMGPGLYVVLFAIIFCETGLVVLPFLPGDSLLFAVGAVAASSGAVSADSARRCSVAPPDGRRPPLRSAPGVLSRSSAAWASPSTTCAFAARFTKLAVASTSPAVCAGSAASLLVRSR